MLSVTAETELGDLRLDVGLEVAAGECLALAGPSGAGKSSVLRIAAGLLRPRAGRVTCGERVWLDGAIDVPPEERHCGYVFQDYALFPNLSAWQNVGYGLPRRHRRERALALLERFGLADRAEARPRTLSGGERQRVALARALAVEPAALLLDEPLSALDARTRAAAGRELAAVLHEAGVPALLVTHDFQEAALLGDRVGVMDAGRIVQIGTGERAGRRARVALRGRLHRRRRADRHGLAGSGRAHARGARRRGRGDLAGHRERPGRRHRLPVGHHAGPARAPSTRARHATTSTSRSSRSPRSATACGSAWRRRSR